MSVVAYPKRTKSMATFVITRKQQVRIYRTRRGGWTSDLSKAYHYPNQRRANLALARMERLDDVIVDSCWIERIEPNE